MNLHTFITNASKQISLHLNCLPPPPQVTMLRFDIDVPCRFKFIQRDISEWLPWKAWFKLNRKLKRRIVNQYPNKTAHIDPSSVSVTYRIMHLLCEKGVMFSEFSELGQAMIPAYNYLPHRLTTERNKSPSVWLNTTNSTLSCYMPSRLVSHV